MVAGTAAPLPGVAVFPGVKGRGFVVRRPRADQSRADDRTALGRVVPGRAGALGHRAAAARCGAAGGRGSIRGSGARRGLRNRGERSTRGGARAAGAGSGRGRDGSGCRAREGCPARHRGGVRDGRRPAVGTAGAQVRHSARLRAVPHLRRRRRYVASLGSVVEPHGTVHVLCFSDEGPGTGPHPVSQAELQAAFGAGDGWSVVALEPDRLQTRFHDVAGAPAWHATVRRVRR
jgi:hypothetical protein